jgi:hypothetical protein
MTACSKRNWFFIIQVSVIDGIMTVNVKKYIYTIFTQYSVNCIIQMVMESGNQNVITEQHRSIRLYCISQIHPTQGLNEITRLEIDMETILNYNCHATRFLSETDKNSGQ